MNSHKISIIIPVYNVEQYLPMCLDSVINQSYKNLEIICINDESPDNSSVILENYAANDSRFKIINQKNTGLSGARNKGIQIASGSYIMFVDSDDWIDVNTCEVVLRLALEHNADVVMWPYIREFKNKSKPKKFFTENLIVFNEQDVKYSLHRRLFGLIDKELMQPENADAIVPACMKLYCSNILKHNNIEFVDTKLIGTEDALFNIEVFTFINKVVYTNECFYHYRKTNTTSLTTTFKPELHNQWDQLFTNMFDFIEKKNLPPVFMQALNNRISLSIIGLGVNELSSSNESPGPLEKMKRIRRIITSDRYNNAFKTLPFRYLPVHWKLFFSFVKCKFVLGIYLLLTIIRYNIKK